MFRLDLPVPDFALFSPFFICGFRSRLLLWLLLQACHFRRFCQFLVGGLLLFQAFRFTLFHQSFPGFLLQWITSSCV
jgi:hypothetical protein